MDWLPPANCRVKMSVLSGACSTTTLAQSTSSSSATIMGMEVFTFCPISGFGDMMVTMPFSPIFTNPLMSNHSSGIRSRASAAGVQPASQLKRRIMPPPATAEAFKKDRLLSVVLTVATIALVAVVLDHVEAVGGHLLAAAVLMAAWMRVYVPQRQMFPDIAASISSSLGEAFWASNAAALMICPAWQ